MATYAGDRTTGFASPAADHVDGTIELSEVLDLRRPSRYPVRVSGDALQARGIRDGDVLIVDTALTPKAGAVVIATVMDEIRVCELTHDASGWKLRPSSSGIDPILIADRADVSIWGIAAGLVRSDI